ncbi:MAG: adenylate/guanylate cyclase domain-containing protein [Nitrososphaeraceae archaeon]
MTFFSSAQGIKFYGDSLNCCIGFLDLVNSTRNVIAITDNKNIRTYYSKFINSLYKITKKYDIKIIKNIGDCIFFYSPATNNTEYIKPFEDFFTCIYSILDKRDQINKELFESNLPAFNYRISIDYGKVELALVGEYSQLDLFGTAVNICSKINSISNQNAINIGEKLYRILKSLSFDRYYDFTPIDEYWLPNNQPYSLYNVNRKTLENFNNSLSSQHVNSQYVNTNINKNPNSFNCRTTIVLVEDNEDDLFCYKLFLKELECNIVSFNDSIKALKYVLSNIFSMNIIVITDIRMNSLNGLQLYQKLKLIKQDLPIIFVTALDITNELRSIIPNMSGDQVLRKPVDKKNFLNSVNKFIHNVK